MEQSRIQTFYIYAYTYIYHIISIISYTYLLDGRKPNKMSPIILFFPLVFLYALRQNFPCKNNYLIQKQRKCYTRGSYNSVLARVSIAVKTHHDQSNCYTTQFLLFFFLFVCFFVFSRQGFSV